MKPKIINTCLQADDIEKYILNKKLFNIRKKSEIFTHLHCCYNCFMQYYEMDVYHQILSTELKKPISEQILNLVEEL